MAKDKARTVADIRADLARNRATMAESVSELVDEVNPKNVAKRGIADAKNFAATEFESLKAQVKDEHGWRTDRLLIIGGAVLGVVVFAVTLTSISHARQRSLANSGRRAIDRG